MAVLRAGLYRGAVATAIRDGVVVAGILGLCPAITAELNEMDATRAWSKSTKTAVGATGAGIIATLMTMPVDAIKTRQQVLILVQLELLLPPVSSPL
jgi:hypothetical protein